MRKKQLLYGGNMRKAQQRIDAWIASGDTETTLILNDLNLNSLPPLPKNLKRLHCSDNNLTSLPALPENLTVLRINSNKLTSLPTLPNSLVILQCDNNTLTNLPTLPEHLIELYCEHNILTRLPKLPNTLTDLACYNNKLSSLPAIPNSLVTFWCYNNNLPDVYYQRDDETHEIYINRIRKLQKSRKNVTNTIKSQGTQKKRRAFGNKPHNVLPVNVKRHISKFMENTNFENINSLKPSNITRKK